MPVSQHDVLLQQTHELARRYSHDELLAIFENPVVILSAPRSGSTLLFKTLQSSDHLWSIGGESHIIFNAFPQLHPSANKFNSGGLKTKDATPDICHTMRAFFLLLLVNNKGQRYIELPEHSRPNTVRLLEKTPRNALNIPFLRVLFPTMKPIFLYRDPRENISSMIEAWNLGIQTGRFVTFENLPGWDRKNWCLLLPPGWRKMKSKSIAEIACFQWCAANETILNNLNKISNSSKMICNYHELIGNTEDTVKNLAEYIGVEYSGGLQTRASEPLPLTGTTVSTPKKNKWERHRSELEPLEKLYQPVYNKLEQQA